MRARIALLGALLLGACERIPGTPQYEDAQILKRGEAAISHDLLDPAAAQFREVRVVRRKKGETAVLQAVNPRVFVCGEVNGKNGFGAYVGFTRFIVGVDKPAVAILKKPASPGPDAIQAECSASWDATCTERLNGARMDEVERTLLFPLWWRADCGPPRSGKGARQ